MKVFQNKVAVSTLIGMSLIIYISANLYWSQVCADEGCSSYFKLAFLQPLIEASLIIIFISIPFLFLPYEYFKKWFLFAFLPIGALSFISIMEINPSSSNMFAQTRAEAIADSRVFWLVITGLFIASMYVVRSKLAYRYWLIGGMTIASVLVLILSNYYLRNTFFGLF